MSQTYNEVVIVGDLTTGSGWREASVAPPAPKPHRSLLHREATRRQAVRGGNEGGHGSHARQERADEG